MSKDCLTRNVEAREKARQEKNVWERRARAAEAQIAAVRAAIAKLNELPPRAGPEYAAAIDDATSHIEDALGE